MASALARAYQNYPFEDLKDATHDFAEPQVLGEARQVLVPRPRWFPYPMEHRDASETSAGGLFAKARPEG